MQIYLSFLAAALYILSILLPGRLRLLISTATTLGWLVHGAALWLTIFSDHALRVGFAVMLSAALWVSVFVCWLENRNFSLEGLRFLLMPNAALMAILPGFFPGSLIALNGKTTMFPWHVIVAMLAYSTLTIAAFHAVVMTIQDKHLHKLRGIRQRQWLQTLIERLPALMTMEKILFRFIIFGFVLLTLTVLSGVIFSEQVLGVAFKWDHKTLLSLLSWLLFAILLAGRFWKGWRGKTVLSFTLSGFITLLLAYVGSRFVLEVLLHRSLA
ncbi:cytochrome c biogenesis protein CcsA [Undibacterium sp. CY18W]|uniref:Cytochrome c biogenesis protein CcsA n=1 Tax=Undibacterium hunanense TaxID=2762292 RepID=A0ABR6ZQG3_9BURK|nr:cytochrome c biogenesis protein CcsA [Undibacterium hunanense]MBC3917768.1 cytochrome c biogenesis protein CcsA [Undibacterium hunanense]